jgi:hypothetical protein
MASNRSRKVEGVRGTRGGGATRGRHSRAGDSDRGSVRAGNGETRSVSRRYEDEERFEGQRRGNFVKRVSRNVGEKVGGMDLDKALVLLHTALALAIVIKQTRSRNQPRKAEPFRSAMSVLNYYLNEGRELSEMQRATLEDIKEELRMLYSREDDEMMSPAR